MKNADEQLMTIFSAALDCDLGANEDAPGVNISILSVTGATGAGGEVRPVLVVAILVHEPGCLDTPV